MGKIFQLNVSITGKPTKYSYDLHPLPSVVLPDFILLKPRQTFLYNFHE
jgi:hypothetical protein